MKRLLQQRFSIRGGKENIKKSKEWWKWLKLQSYWSFYAVVVLLTTKSPFCCKVLSKKFYIIAFLIIVPKYSSKNCKQILEILKFIKYKGFSLLHGFFLINMKAKTRQKKMPKEEFILLLLASLTPNIQRKYFEKLSSVKKQ